MRNHQHAAGEFEQGIFQRTQRFDVDVVGRFVEQQDVGARQQRMRQMQPAAFTAGQRADFFLLILALEIKTAEIGARRHFEFADVDDVEPAGNRLPRGLLVGQGLARLVDHRQFHRRADDDLAGIRGFLAENHAEDGRFTRTVRTDDADDGAWRNRKRQLVDQQPVAVTFGNVLELDHAVAEAVGNGDENFLCLGALLVIKGRQFFKTRNPRF